jgi:hypothetical protein
VDHGVDGLAGEQLLCLVLVAQIERLNGKVCPVMASSREITVGLELAKLSTISTSCPAATSWMTVCDPI